MPVMTLTRDPLDPHLSPLPQGAEVGCNARSRTSYPASRIPHSASRIKGAPEIPGGDGAIRAPLLADLLELFRRRQFSSAKRFRETFLDAVVRDRPDVEPTELKEQQHLDGPSSDPAHFCEPRDDFFVRHPHQFAARRDGALECFRGEILQRRGLAPRQTAGAE